MKQTSDFECIRVFQALWHTVDVTLMNSTFSLIVSGMSSRSSSSSSRASPACSLCLESWRLVLCYYFQGSVCCWLGRKCPSGQFSWLKVGVCKVLCTRTLSLLPLRELRRQLRLFLDSGIPLKSWIVEVFPDREDFKINSRTKFRVFLFNRILEWLAC